MQVSQKVVLFCAAISVGTALAVSAAEVEENAVDIGNAIKSGDILPLEQVIDRATAEYPGTITEIELGSSDGRYTYEIDVVDDAGVKRELQLDAKTAELLSAKLDNDDAEELAKADSEDEEAAAQEDEGEDDGDEEN